MNPKEIFKRWREIPELKNEYEQVKKQFSHLPDNKADCMARGAVLNYFVCGQWQKWLPIFQEKETSQTSLDSQNSSKT